jgi:hypothetical protein
MKYCNAGTHHIYLRAGAGKDLGQLCCSVLKPAKNRVDLANTSGFLTAMQSPDWRNKFKQLETGPLDAGVCNKCITDEEWNGLSQRKKINTLTGDGRFFLKIDFSNKCNLKCVMCNSKRSTAWLKDEQKLNRAIPGFDFEEEPSQNMDDNFWLEMPLDFWKNLGAIEVSGGEPLYHSQFIDFLEFLIEYVPNMLLRIITNGTLLDARILTILAKFKNVEILVSVDGWQDSIYQYARGGKQHELPKVKENILKFFGVVSKTSIVDTNHCITYDQKPIAQKWLQDQGISTISYQQDYCTSPGYMDSRRVLPSYIYNLGEKSLEKQQQFKTYILALDKIRGTDILTVRPEFETWFRDLDKVN